MLKRFRAVSVTVSLACALAPAGSVAARQQSDGKRAALATGRRGGELTVVAADVQLLLIAPGGKETGYDPQSKKVVKGIAHSAYDQDALLAFDSGRVDPSTTQTLTVKRPNAGTYRLVVSQGTAADGEEYEVRITLDRLGGYEAGIVRITGTATRGNSTTYELKVKADPANVVIVNRARRVAQAP